jgi:hypothetical protein
MAAKPAPNDMPCITLSFGLLSYTSKDAPDRETDAAGRKKVSLWCIRSAFQTSIGTERLLRKPLPDLSQVKNGLSAG